ncbi:hypothetical protein J8I87_20135 [Paraburkholderia sp. LEh10]|uniref:hypothetical protein n=1 Tax=Paraburkholderia sp. LEh10 TaxID=2821353 RepID=UPI001AEA22D9|nr:hypothetical protein [Paraburkholderia sp. LEh10]MBP0591993.1 hypothetical protein [Paraburkholderia sp. LEh10]
MLYYSETLRGDRDTEHVLYCVPSIRSEVYYRYSSVYLHPAQQYFPESGIDRFNEAKYFAFKGFFEIGGWGRDHCQWPDCCNRATDGSETGRVYPLKSGPNSNCKA